MTVWSIRLEEKATARYVQRFMLVGIMGTLLDVALFLALHVGLGIPTLVANTISFGTGGLNNFLMHRYWTFAQRRRSEFGPQFVRFVLASVGAISVNNLIMLVLAPTFHGMVSDPMYSDFMAKAGAAVVTTLWSLLLNSFWTFAPPKEVQA